MKIIVETIYFHFCTLDKMQTFILWSSLFLYKFIVSASIVCVCHVQHVIYTNHNWICSTYLNKFPTKNPRHTTNSRLCKMEYHNPYKLYIKSSIKSFGRESFKQITHEFHQPSSSTTSSLSSSLLLESEPKPRTNWKEKLCKFLWFFFNSVPKL